MKDVKEVSHLYWQGDDDGADEDHKGNNVDIRIINVDFFPWIDIGVV